MYKLVKKSLSLKKNVILGVQILRMIYAYLIVVLHFGHNTGQLYNFCWKYIDFYVTSFFLISFYFSFKVFSSRYIAKVKERFIRLLFPYIFWPLFIFIKRKYRAYKRGMSCQHSYKDLYYQFLVGNPIHGLMWYLFDLIFLSLFFAVIAFLFKDYHLYFLYFLFFLILIYNYTHFHDRFMQQFPRYHIQHSFEIIHEALTFSITGYILGSLNLLRKLTRKKIAFIIFAPIFYVVRYHQEVFDYFPGFNVLFNDIFISCIFIFFGTIPFKHYTPKIIFRWINILTRHTGGIYYIHTQTYEYLTEYFGSVAKKDLKATIVIYATSYAVCEIGSQIFKKYRLKYIFN